MYFSKKTWEADFSNPEIQDIKMNQSPHPQITLVFFSNKSPFKAQNFLQDTNLQKIHKTSFKYNNFYTNKLKLQQVLH